VTLIKRSNGTGLGKRAAKKLKKSSMSMESLRLRSLNSPCGPDAAVGTKQANIKVKKDPRALKKGPKIRRVVTKYLISDFKHITFLNI
jgi:hypothetical protein